jgi:hypothetical protein
MDINAFAVVKPNYMVSNTIKKDTVLRNDPKKETEGMEKTTRGKITDTVQIKEMESAKEVKQPGKKEEPGNIITNPAIVKDEKDLKKDGTEITIQKNPYIIMQQKDRDGVEVVFVDASVANDTIRIFVPVYGADAVNKEEGVEKDTTEKEHNKIPIKVAEQKEEKFLDFTVSNNTKSNDDYLSLRKKIAGLENEEAMIKTAEKAFKQKCYLTAHIRNISVLFLTEENKFLFFQSAYPFIYDSDQFKNLLDELKDPASREKFKALIQK